MRESIIHVVVDLDLTWPRGLLFYHLCATGFTYPTELSQYEYRMHASEYFRFIVSRLSFVYLHTRCSTAVALHNLLANQEVRWRLHKVSLSRLLS